MKQHIRFYSTNESLTLASKIYQFISYAQLLSDSSKLVLQSGTDQKTPIHKAVYRDFDRKGESALLPFYYNLVRKLACALREEYDIFEWAVQRYPSLRVQYPSNVSVFEHHIDYDYFHPRGEINHFLAITDCIDDSALWVEENLGWNNFKPLNLKKGHYAVLNTSVFKHGDKINTTGETRLSCDFRFIPLHVLEANHRDNVSITAGKKFTTEDYYINIRELS